MNSFLVFSKIFCDKLVNGFVRFFQIIIGTLMKI